MNITEKILANAYGVKEVQPGEIIEARVDLAMSHDGTSPPTINTFNKIAEKVWDPDKIVMVFRSQRACKYNWFCRIPESYP